MDCEGKMGTSRKLLGPISRGTPHTGRRDALTARYLLEGAGLGEDGVHGGNLGGREDESAGAASGTLAGRNRARRLRHCWKIVVAGVDIDYVQIRGLGKDARCLSCLQLRRQLI